MNSALQTVAILAIALALMWIAAMYGGDLRDRRAWFDLRHDHCEQEVAYVMRDQKRAESAQERQWEERDIYLECMERYK